MVIELDDNGDIIRSLHDPTGHRFRGVTEVREESGILFFGSMDRGFVGTLKVSLLPDPIPSSKGGGLFGGGAGGELLLLCLDVYFGVVVAGGAVLLLLSRWW